MVNYIHHTQGISYNHLSRYELMNKFEQSIHQTKLIVSSILGKIKSKI